MTGPGPQGSGISIASAASTVNARGADSGLSFPARSVARMVSVCEPFSVNVRVRPGEQAVKSVSSSKRHANDAPSSASKANQGRSGAAAPCAGRSMTGIAGATVSTTKRWASAMPVTPAWTARADRV